MDEKRRSRLAAGVDGMPHPETSSDIFSGSPWNSDLDDLVGDEMKHFDFYDLVELRDGFYDAFYLCDGGERTAALDEALLDDQERTASLRSKIQTYVTEQVRDARELLRDLTSTRAGLQLSKDFLAFLIAYALVLIGPVRHWLGRYSYVTAVSAVYNHPGRPLGAQIDGAIGTIAGTAVGLGWGALGLRLSGATNRAREGRAGVLAAFLLSFLVLLSLLRATFARLYQAVVCAGIAVSFALLAEVAPGPPRWQRFFGYGVSWALGQAVSMAVCVLFLPDAGSRPVATTVNRAFKVMLDCLVFPRSDDPGRRRELARVFVELSRAYRDLAMNISITTLGPRDVLKLRDRMQAVLRSLLPIRPNTSLFSHLENQPADTSNPGVTVAKLSEPARQLVLTIRRTLETCDAVLMQKGGLGGMRLAPNASGGIPASLKEMQAAAKKYDQAEDALLQCKSVPSTYFYSTESSAIFMFCRYLRQVAATVDALAQAIANIEGALPMHAKLHLPSYPLSKGLYQTTAQVLHGRGGVTAGAYYRSFALIEEAIGRSRSMTYHPLPRSDSRHLEDEKDGHEDDSYATVGLEDAEQASKAGQLAHKVWTFLHQLQGFEAKYAFKATVTIALITTPAWNTRSMDWWDKHDGWLGVAMAWIMMHSRVGGSIKDLVTRLLACVAGGLWAYLAALSKPGSPYVLAVFATLFMAPMLYRYTQSAHTKSGLAACIAFTTISLAIYDSHHHDGAVQQMDPAVSAFARVCTFVVAVTGAAVVNWLLWPFVARHELRNGLASMLLYASILYRSIVGSYVYDDDDDDDEYTTEDSERGETERVMGSQDEDIAEQKEEEALEGRLREGFVRLHEMFTLTAHEPRLRGSLDTAPYLALLQSLERFFEHLVAVRQSSLFFRRRQQRRPRRGREPTSSSSPAAADADHNDGDEKGDEDEKMLLLLPYRRDAAASVLAVLFVMAGALRGRRPLPRYLPSAAVARKRLLQLVQDDELRERAMNRGKIEAAVVGVEGEHDGKGDADMDNGAARWWERIHGYAYGESLTGCVAELQAMERHVKAIVGVQDLDQCDPASHDEHRV